MKAKKLIAAGIAASMSLLTLAGCGTAGNTGNSGGDTAKEDTVKEDTAKKDTDEEDTGSVYFLNFKSELSAEWEEVAGSFTKETGMNMKVVTAGSGTYEQTLKSELSKKEMPTLFNVNGPIGYQTWKDYTMDLKDTNLYSWLNTPDLAVERVKMRVAAGGHNIPEATIRRRYEAGIHNLFELYLPICVYWMITDNSMSPMEVIA